MQYLSLQTLGDFDGGLLAIHTNQAIRQVQLDLQDRPGLSKKRSVTITR